MAPWYATATPPAPDRRALEDEHTRILAQAVGDHLPYELALRAVGRTAPGRAPCYEQLVSPCSAPAVGVSRRPSVLDGVQSVGGERPSVTAGESEAKIRPARGEDALAIHVLHADCFDDLFAGLLGDYLPSTDERAERERSWTGPIGSPDDRHALVVAERHKRVIGFVAVGPTRDADDDAQTTGELRTVMVANDARDMGVGQALITAGERAMRDHGLSTATLWVLPENSPAVRCYERCGWRPDGSEKSMQVGGHQIRTVRYRKQLAP